MHRTEGISKDSRLFRGTMPGLYNATEQRASPGTAGFSNGQCLVCTMPQNRGHLQGQLAFPMDNAWSVQCHRTEGISRDSWLFQWTMPGLYNATEQRASPGTAGFSNGQCLVCTMPQNRGHLQGQLAFPMDNAWSVQCHRTEGISRDSWLFQWTMPGLYSATEQRASPGTAGFSNGQCLVCTMPQNRGHLRGQIFPWGQVWPEQHKYRTGGISKDRWHFHRNDCRTFCG